MFLISKIQEIFFSLYSQKQVFENRKQKLLPNITYVFPENIITGNYILASFYIIPLR